MVMSECVDFEMKPAIGNTRAACAEVLDKYADMEKPQFIVSAKASNLFRGLGPVVRNRAGIYSDGRDHCNFSYTLMGETTVTFQFVVSYCDYRLWFTVVWRDHCDYQF